MGETKDIWGVKDEKEGRESDTEGRGEEGGGKAEP